MPRKASVKEVKEVANEKGNVESVDPLTTDAPTPINDLIEIHTPFYEPLTKEELAKAKDKKTPEDKKTTKNEYLWKLIRCKYLLTIKLCSGDNLIYNFNTFLNFSLSESSIPYARQIYTLCNRSHIKN